MDSISDNVLLHLPFKLYRLLFHEGFDFFFTLMHLQGCLPNGQKIAVKRLSGQSMQGEEQFRNEILLVAKLQHRNLASLLGYCSEAEERLLVYEFVGNGSLDHFIFGITFSLFS